MAPCPRPWKIPERMERSQQRMSMSVGSFTGRRTHSRQFFTGAAGLALLAAMVTSLMAQTAPAAAQRAVAPTGHTLAESALPVAVVDGPVEFEAAAAWSWEEPAAHGAGEPTRRLLLAGDVRIRLANHAWAARKAAVWLAPLPAGSVHAAPGVWQVFVYLEDARSIGISTIAMSGARVPVQAIIRTAAAGEGWDDPSAGVELHAPVLHRRQPDDALVGEGERVLASRLQALGNPQAQPLPPATPAPTALAPQPIFAEGILTLAVGHAAREPGEEDDVVLLTGRATIQYWDRQRDTTLQMTAERAVLFIDPQAPHGRSFDIRLVRGIYLEGDVAATDGQYTLRSPRIYYDIERDRALLVDAVFWTYDQQRRMPLYLRAGMLRQEAANQFRAESARLSNTAFLDPDLSIGVSSVTLYRVERPDGEARNYIDARNITLRTGDVPFFYLPILRGDPQAIPLRGVSVGRARGAGTTIRTGWDLYGIVGLDRPPGHDATLNVDWYAERGFGLGAEYTWTGRDSAGGLLGYALPWDHGDDFLAGIRRDPPQRLRSIVAGDHREVLDDRWTLLLEGGYVSDPAFIPAFHLRDRFNDRYHKDRREFTNVAYLRRVEDNAFLSVEVSARLQNFLINEYLIQSPGYSVDKLPEVRYFRAADNVLPRWPGLLTWTHEYRGGVVRMNFHEADAGQLGMLTAGRAAAFWGITPDQSPADVLRARGLHEDPVLRFDTRHELAMPMTAGVLNITPFAVGRATHYDQDFSDFSAEMDEPYRLWGSAGITASTELVRVNNTISSRLLDLHRVRHIVQPSVTLWHAETTIGRADLPIFDAAVEDLVEGSAVRFGIDQTWQTQRGGPGRWRSVDVFRFNTELVVASGEVTRTSPIPRHIEFRPEYGVMGGTFGTAEAAWQVTEVLGIGGEAVYDFEDNAVPRASFGATLEHVPDFSLYTEIRYLRPQDQTYANAGVRYSITPKYLVGFATSYDTDRREFATFTGDFQRRLPNMIIGIGLMYNNITGDTSVGLLFQPVGMEMVPTRVRGAGAHAGFGR
jgi:hypothetical protein